MAPILHLVHSSPPCRAVQMTAQAIGLDLELKEVDIANGGFTKESFLKLNPQHTVPTLEDNSFVLWDSHAIMIYLVSKYARNDSLYPKDLKKRAIVDQRLHFENGTLWPRLLNLMSLEMFGDDRATGWEGDYAFELNDSHNYDRTSLQLPVRTGKQKQFDQQSKDAILEAYGFLEALLDDNLWVAGNTPTIADFSIVTTVSMTSLEHVVPIIPEKFPRITAWFKRCESLSVYEINQRQLPIVMGMLKMLLQLE